MKPFDDESVRLANAVNMQVEVVTLKDCFAAQALGQLFIITHQVCLVFTYVRKITFLTNSHGN